VDKHFVTDDGDRTEVGWEREKGCTLDEKELNP
jgi:hypothetical protein